MRVVFEGTIESLDAYKALRAKGALDRDSDDDDEYMDFDVGADEDVGNPNNTAVSSDSAEGITQSISDAYEPSPKDSESSSDLISNWVVVERLNSMASAGHQISVAVPKTHISTPFWSPSPISVGQENEPEQLPCQSDKPQTTANEWDMLDDLDFDFTEGLGSEFARKVTRAPANAFDCDLPFPSIEYTPTPSGA